MSLRRWSLSRLLLALALCAPLTACQPESSSTKNGQKDKNVPTKDGASPSTPKNETPPAKTGDTPKNTGSPEKGKTQ